MCRNLWTRKFSEIRAETLLFKTQCRLLLIYSSLHVKKKKKKGKVPRSLPAPQPFVGSVQQCGAHTPLLILLPSTLCSVTRPSHLGNKIIKNQGRLTRKINYLQNKLIINSKDYFGNTQNTSTDFQRWLLKWQTFLHYHYHNSSLGLKSWWLI